MHYTKIYLFSFLDLSSWNATSRFSKFPYFFFFLDGWTNTSRNGVHISTWRYTVCSYQKVWLVLARRYSWFSTWSSIVLSWKFISRRICLFLLCGHSARTYISRDICPHYILLPFSPLKVQVFFYLDESTGCFLPQSTHCSGCFLLRLKNRLFSSSRFRLFSTRRYKLCSLPEVSDLLGL